MNPKIWSFFVRIDSPLSGNRGESSGSSGAREGGKKRKEWIEARKDHVLRQESQMRVSTKSLTLHSIRGWISHSKLQDLRYDLNLATATSWLAALAPPRSLRW